MLHFTPWKVFAVIAIFLATGGVCLPWGAKAEAQQVSPAGMGQHDGVHLVYKIDTDDLRRKWMDRVAAEVRLILMEERVGHSGITANMDEVRVVLRDESKADLVLAKFKPLSGSVGGIFGMFGSPEIEIIRDGGAIVLKSSQAGIIKHIADATRETLDVLKMRVDPDGVKRIRFVQQGADGISMNAPGFKDAAELKKLAARTSTLSFQLVDTSVTPEKAKVAGAPPGSALYSARSGTQVNDGLPYLLYKETIATNADLLSVSATFDYNNMPVIGFRLTAGGTRRFAKATAENIGKPFAIVLDGEVISAPIIREPILGGSGQISGNFTVAEANDIALRLRSGALPAKLTLIEERAPGGSSSEGQTR